MKQEINLELIKKLHDLGAYHIDITNGTFIVASFRPEYPTDMNVPVALPTAPLLSGSPVMNSQLQNDDTK
jgi:hypothetical protein